LPAASNAVTRSVSRTRGERTSRRADFDLTFTRMRTLRVARRRRLPRATTRERRPTFATRLARSRQGSEQVAR
jgi:hypothetical protein